MKAGMHGGGGEGRGAEAWGVEGAGRLAERPSERDDRVSQIKKEITVKAKE